MVLANRRKLLLDCRQIAISLPLRNSKVRLRNRRILYNFKRYIYSSPFLSLALDSRL